MLDKTQIKNSEYELKESNNFVYTEEQIMSLSREELMEIISIKTSDSIVIYFDEVSNIEIDQVLLNNAEIIPITRYEKYEELTEKFARFKLFKIMYDPSNRITSIQRALISQLTDLEKLFTIKTNEVMNKIADDMSRIESTLLDRITPIVEELEKKINTNTDRLNISLNQLNNKAEELPIMKINSTINKLDRISTLLADVIE